MFESIIGFFYIVLYQPMFNALVFLYNYVPGHDFGVAIIILTLAIRLILYPLSVKAVNSQRSLQKLQPLIQEIQKKYKDDKEKQARETLALYKKEKINPFSGLIVAIIQLPILLALYRVFWNGLNPNELSALYGFVANPGQINALFLRIINLAKPNFILAVIAGIAQYLQAKMLAPQTKSKTNNQSKQTNISHAMQKQMTYFMPIFTVIILIGLPSALGLYWATSSLFSVIQQRLTFRKAEQIQNPKP